MAATARCVLKSLRRLGARLFIFNYDICTSIWAELLAVLNGLKIARSKGYRHLMVHIDSEITVKLVFGVAVAPSSHFRIIKMCCKLLMHDHWET